MSGKNYKIGDFLIRQKEPIFLDDKVEYKRLTIKMYGKGVLLRDKEFGSNIGTKKQFTVESGQFILSKIDARNGAFGIIPNSCDGGIITGNFWSYELNEKIVNIDWFNLFVSTDNFIDVCTKSSSGATNRKYLNENTFLDYDIFIPNIDEQKYLITKFLNNKNNFDGFNKINTKNQNYIKLLKQSILQEAIEGKLTKSWREKNQDIEPASVLLEKIKEEKEVLIKQKKLKKQKKLDPIGEEDIPFEIPESWKWCRLGDIIKESGNLNIHSQLNENELINYVDIASIDNKNYKIGEIIPQKVSKLSSRARRVLKKGYIIYSLVRPYLNNLAIINNEKENYIGSTGFNVFKPIFIDINYVFNFLLSNYIKDYYLELMKGFNSPGITNDNFVNTLFPLPPLSEQKEIVKKVEELMKLCDELEKQTLEAKENSENLMNAVLGEVFNQKK